MDKSERNKALQQDTALARSTVPGESAASQARDTADWVAKYKIVTISRGMEPEQCVRLSEALYQGGIRLMEITLNQKEEPPYPATTETILNLAQMWKGKMKIGAGTVLTPRQLCLAKEAGASYIVTPNTNPEIIREAKAMDLAVLAGAMTPTEIVNAYEAGADFIKLFPTSCLGMDYIKAIRAPLSHIPMLAVGGVSEKNIAAYLQAGMAGAGVGGRLMSREWVASGEFDKVTALAREYVRNAGLEDIESL